MVARRVASIGQQLASMLRPRIEGKINAYPVGYVFSEDGWTNPQGVYFKPLKDESGRMVSLSKFSSVDCPAPSLHPDAPVIRGQASIKQSVCRKCVHRLPKSCCAVLRGAARGDLRDLLNDVGNALKEVDGA